MSHLSKLKTKVTDNRIIEKVAKDMRWTIEYHARFENAYSHEVVEDATILTDQNGRIRMVTDNTGSVQVDEWVGGMGTSYQSFLQEYGAEIIADTAAREGGIISSRHTDTDTGDILIEVTI